MSRRTLRLIFLIGVTTSLSLYGLVGMQSASAATITVTTFEDENTDPGPETGCALREAIIAANEDDPFGGCPTGDGADTIVLAAGTYTLDIGGGGDTQGDLDIEDEDSEPSADLTIQGAGANATTIMQTSPDVRVIEVENQGDFNVTLSGVTVSGGDENSDGGGIKNDNQTLRLFGVHVTGNATTQDGGGIDNSFGGVLAMRESAITANTAEDQAGGLDSDGIARLTNVTVSGNEADDSGGGIRSTGQTHLQNVTVTANIADANAGGAGNGGGLQSQGAPFGDAVLRLRLRNTIVAENADFSGAGDEVHPDCTGVIVSEGHNLIGNEADCNYATAAGDLVGTGAAPINPLLGPLALNGGTTPNHALLAGSPAINAGDTGGAPPIDQRGLPRDAAPDIGAYEVQAPAAVPMCKGKAATLVGTAGNDTLIGTAARDIVAALGGKDTVKTKGGKDLVCAGAGKDKAGGGAGKDRLLGQGGKDRLKGAGGNDRLNGGKGRDRCNGGPGTDKGNCEVEISIP